MPEDPLPGPADMAGTKLLDLHCDLGQGFYFAKPLPMEGIDELLAARKALAKREPELST